MPSLRVGVLAVLASLSAEQDIQSVLQPPKSCRGRALLQSPAAPAREGIPPDVLVVQLDRLNGRSTKGCEGAEKRSFYVGNISIGYPAQVLQVVFDTSSDTILLPHRVCTSKACAEHRRYSSWRSQTSVDVDLTGNRIQKQSRLVMGSVERDAAMMQFVMSDLGAGNATGPLVRDNVCVKSRTGAKVCAKPSVVVAISLDDVPFRAMPSDGIVGLGFPAITRAPMASFFGNLIESNRDMPPQFGMSFGPAGGELHIGGYHPSALGAPLQWFPVHSPEEGYWQVPIRAVRVGNATHDACEVGCHAIIDSGAVRLGVQKGNLPRLQSALNSARRVHRQCQGPDLEFDLGGMSVSLRAEDYTDSDCRPDLGPLDLEEPLFKGVYAFGETVLRQYFVAFDWEGRKLGFAPTSGAGGRLGAASARVEQVFL